MGLDSKISRLVVENVSLKMPTDRYQEHAAFRNPLKFVADFYTSRAKKNQETILHDISFSLQSGDRLGIIGVNGSGKSSLIRVIAGILHPDSGRVMINGSIASLISISMGLNLRATGHENIYLRGLHMELSLKEINAQLPEIVEFTELGTHLNKPVQTYSTGMRLRLAFAISTMISAKILLMDEWIGSGDKVFGEKFRKRLDGLLEKSDVFVIASHNLNLVKSRCNLGLVLDGGQQKYFGGINEAADFYEALPIGRAN